MSSNYLVLLSCLALSACATHAKTYQPPSRVKMDASSQRVSTAVTKARASATKVYEKVKAAQDTAEVVVKLSDTVRKQLESVTNVPQEVTDNVAHLQFVEQNLMVKLADAAVVYNILSKELDEAQLAKSQLIKDQAEYVGNAQKLADFATSERNQRIDVEKKLSWYRWHSWLMKIATVVIVLVVIFVLFLWVSGKLAGLASKLP